MRYKTRREDLLIIHIIIILCCLGKGYVMIHDQLPLWLIFATGALGGGVLLYALDLRRKWYKKKGVRLDGYISECKRYPNGRGEDIYFLVITFTDNGEKKTRKTEGYMGNPNCKLLNRKCSIYKWNGKYIEADFHVAPESMHKKMLDIPVKNPLL